MFVKHTSRFLGNHSGLQMFKEILAPSRTRHPANAALCAAGAAGDSVMATHQEAQRQRLQPDAALWERT